MKRLGYHTMRRGFTLIELSVAIMMGMMTGAMVLALFNQQLAFLKEYHKQSFLIEDAPVISMYVSRLVGKADRFRLHDSVADAVGNLRPRLTASPVLLMKFRQPNGEMRDSILSFQRLNGRLALYYYAVPTDRLVPLGDPQWYITNKPTNVTFAMGTNDVLQDQGVLRMTLTGPAGEQITYSGTMQQ